MKSWKLYGLALFGASLGTAGGVAGVVAARGWHPWLMHLAGAGAWVGCYPVWFAMTSGTNGGFLGPASTWSVAGSGLAVLIALVMGEPQTRLEWFGFGLIVLGAAVRALGGKE